MRSTRPRLKLSGYTSAARVDAVFASSMVDVACIDELSPDAAFIVADDPDWPSGPEDYRWLCEIIIETLREHGIHGTEVSFEPQSGMGGCHVRGSGPQP